MLERLLIAGSGGQGIIITGRLLATVAVKSYPFVTFFPAYGAEVRGGTSNCQVVLSSNEISSPLCENLESIILMNPASIERFAPRARRHSLLLVNSSLCRIPASLRAIRIRATEMADELGNVRGANLIMLGAYLARKPLVPSAHVEQGIRQIFEGKTPEIVDLNLKAFRTGLAT